MKERQYQEIKEKASEREASTLKDELDELKAFAPPVVREQRRLSELLEEQRLRVKELTAVADHVERQVSAAHPSAKEELKPLHRNRVSIFRQSQGAMTTPSLLSEVELLRRRVVEMEGKDEELIRMWDQCRDLDRSLSRETSHCRSLKVEVDKLNGRISEMDRLEEVLGKSKQDCGVLKGSLEREREVSKALRGELDALKTKVRELEAAEGQLGKSEAVIRQDLAKLRSLTVALVEDRKTTAERLRQAEEKLNRKEGKRNEQSNLATMTERLREERQQALRSKADLEERMKGMAKEKCDLRDRLQTEGERNGELQSKYTTTKKRLQVLENRREREKCTHGSLPNNADHRCHSEDNRVKELTLELERLQKRLRDKEVMEEGLMTVEKDFESLQKRFRDEQRRSRALAEELEVAKRELSRYEQAEKQEVNQEHLLLCRLQKEQVKSRLLGREVDALKQKLQQLMGTEESVCRAQAARSTLQRRLTRQEASNQELAREMKELCGELDRHGQMKSLTPGADRQRHADRRRATKEVQTEPADFRESGEAPGGEHRDEERHSSPVSNLNSTNNNVSRYGVDVHQAANGEVVMLTHTPGQPLQITVTPHHILNTATLEISSPNGDAAASYTSTALIATGGASPRQRITIIQNSALSAVNARTPPPSPDRTASPISRASNPNSPRCATPDRGGSPVQVGAARTASPEPADGANPAVCRETPERRSSRQPQRTGGGGGADTSPGIVATEDNRIHIHLGSPYGQSLNGTTPVGPYYLRHEQRTQVLANGCHVKGVGVITSSITISPAASSASHSSNITVSGLFH